MHDAYVLLFSVLPSLHYSIIFFDTSNNTLPVVYARDHWRGLDSCSGLFLEFSEHIVQGKKDSVVISHDCGDVVFTSVPVYLSIGFFLCST